MGIWLFLLRFYTQQFYFNCVFRKINCVFTQIRSLSTALVFINKCNKSTPVFSNYKQYLYNQINIEKKIAMNRDQLESHEQKWIFFPSIQIQVLGFIFIYIWKASGVFLSITSITCLLVSFSHYY